MHFPSIRQMKKSGRGFFSGLRSGYRERCNWIFTDGLVRRKGLFAGMFHSFFYVPQQIHNNPKSLIINGILFPILFQSCAPRHPHLNKQIHAGHMGSFFPCRAFDFVTTPFFQNNKHMEYHSWHVFVCAQVCLHMCMLCLVKLAPSSLPVVLQSNRFLLMALISFSQKKTRGVKHLARQIGQGAFSSREARTEGPS